MRIFGKTEIEKIRDEMRGAYLREFIDTFLDDDSEVYDTFIDFSAVSAVKAQLTDYKPKTFAGMERKLNATCKKLGYGRSVADGFIADYRMTFLEQYVGNDIKGALIFDGAMSESFCEYFERAHLSRLPQEYIFFFIYPAKKLHHIQDYDIPRKYREELSERFFSRIKGVDQLRALVQEFALRHPYYRSYPYFV